MIHPLSTGLGSRETRRVGQAAVSLLFWALGLAVMFGPFLRDRDAADSEGNDPGRLVSETDRPFGEQLEEFDAEFDADLTGALAVAEELYLSEGSEMLEGLIDFSRLESGERAYEMHCTGCHGSTADGAGPAARHLDPRPRAIAKGVFKFTSTATGEPPLREDLFQTLTRGLAGSSMPDFRLLSSELRWDMVEYVRYIAMRGAFRRLVLEIAQDDEEVPDEEDMLEYAEIVLEAWSPQYLKPVFPPITEPEYDEDSVERGREVFTDTSGANCSSCHGVTGIGDGPSSGDFRDDWGYPIVPRDLTTGVFRAGNSSADIYRSIMTGINGTPMPSYGSSIPPEDIWALVHYIQSLGVAR